MVDGSVRGRPQRTFVRSLVRLPYWAHHVINCRLPRDRVQRSSSMQHVDKRLSLIRRRLSERLFIVQARDVTAWYACVCVRACVKILQGTASSVASVWMGLKSPVCRSTKLHGQTHTHTSVCRTSVYRWYRIYIPSDMILHLVPVTSYPTDWIGFALWVLKWWCKRTAFLKFTRKSPINVARSMCNMCECICVYSFFATTAWWNKMNMYNSISTTNSMWNCEWDVAYSLKF